MTLYECYDKRRGALYARLTQAQTLSEGSLALNAALDGVLYDYANDCGDDELRELAAEMTSAVKTAFPLLECASDTKIWERGSGGERVKAPKWPAWLCLILGAAALVGVIFIFFAQRPDVHVEDWTAWALGIAAGAAGLFLSGVFFIRAPKSLAPEKTDKKVDVSINAEDASRRLAAVVLQMDKSLDAKRALLAAKSAEERSAGLSPAQLELVTALLEGAYSESGEIALESLGEVEHYLRRSGIDTLEYNGSDESCFELLPGERTATLRPALLCDGRLIKKGLATYAEEGAR